MSSISRWYCSASRDERLKSRFVAINKPLCSIPNESKYNELYHIIKSKVHEVRGIFLFLQLRRLYQQFVQVAIGFFSCRDGCVVPCSAPPSTAQHNAAIATLFLIRDPWVASLQPKVYQREYRYLNCSEADGRTRTDD